MRASEKVRCIVQYKLSIYGIIELTREGEIDRTSANLWKK